MAYDESLAKRIDELTKGKKARLANAVGQGFSKKEMFGGIAYLLNGNMCIGVHKAEVIIRYDPQRDDVANSKNVRPFDITGRPMKGWALVNSEGVKGNGLTTWFDLSFDFVKTLPPK